MIRMRAREARILISNRIEEKLRKDAYINEQNRRIRGDIINNITDSADTICDCDKDD